MIKNDPIELHIDVTGSITGEKYLGIFKVRPLISLGKRIRLDELRREFLGDAQASGAGNEAVTIASMTAKVAVHLVEAPTWWGTNGLEIIDPEPLKEIFEKIIELEEQKMQKTTSDGAKAAEALKEKLG